MTLLLAEDTEVQFPLGRGGDVKATVAEHRALTLEPALGSFGEYLRPIGIIARPDVGDGTIGKLESELEGLFDLDKEFRLGLRQFLGGNGDRIGVGRHADPLDGIDAHVRQRSAASELLLDAPRLATECVAVGALNLHERTKLLGLGQADELLVIRIEVKTIADGEALAGLLARSDHRVALGGRNGHRLLADDMLTGAESREDVLGVDAGRRDHIDDIDRLIGSDLVPLFV